MKELVDKNGNPTGIYVIDEENENNVTVKDTEEVTDKNNDKVEEINENVVSDTENVNEESTIAIEERLNNKTMEENLNSSLMIMGIGMTAVFSVLFVLYGIVKIMGHFAKDKKENA